MTEERKPEYPEKTADDELQETMTTITSDDKGRR